MIVIGIDAATKTGWSIYEPGFGVIESGVEDFSKKRGESNGFVFMRFRKWLKDLIITANMQGDIALIVYEQAHHRGGAATELCVGLTTRVQEIAAKERIEHAPIHTGTLKKWATGKGNSGKKEMIAASVKHLGRSPVDDNEADAVLLAAYAVDEYLV